MIATVQPLIRSPMKSSRWYEWSHEMIGNVARKQDLIDFFEHRPSCDTRTGFEMKREKI